MPGRATDSERGEMTSRQFIRYQLLRLDLGHDLPHIITDKATRRAIAPPEEVFAPHPELRSST